MRNGLGAHGVVGGLAALVLLLAVGALLARSPGAFSPPEQAPIANDQKSDNLSTPVYTQWREDEWPNYVRPVGKATYVSTLDAGEVRYSPLDELGRAGRVEACVTYPLMRRRCTHVHEEELPDPAGWRHNAQVTIDLPGGGSYHGWFWNRSHLLARSLGGDDTPRNLITGTRMQNVGANDGQGGMAYVEGLCRAWLKMHQDETLSYVSAPLYEGNELVPRSVLVDVRSSDGALDQEFEVYNAARGYEIDYASGDFAPSS